jgi:SAM-dependent methyltransferase
MEVKDNFSAHSKRYAAFRPAYPGALAEWMCTLVKDTGNAWDCGTGNGQMAGLLAERFKKVYATDISSNQLSQAVKKKNIFYLKTRAEKTSFPSDYFSLITVAQAIHWFDFDEFYREAHRTSKPGGILAVTGYSLFNTDRESDRIIRKFYDEQTGPFWDPERRYIDEDYKTIPFPFTEIPAPSFKMEFQWDLNQLTGFIQTWSGVQHFIKAKGYDPVPELHAKLSAIWKKDEKKTVTFPVLLRVGKIK